jgi:ABC-type dipeptide/oligopeptide/nickel transport system ATPase component
MTAVLQVEDLKTHFFTRAGVVPAVDGVSFTVNGRGPGPGGRKRLGQDRHRLFDHGLVDPPGRIVGGRILYRRRDLASVGEREWRRSGAATSR